MKIVRNTARIAETQASNLLAAPVDSLTEFDATILARVAETLLATVLLVEHSHWVAAAGTTRQLFELLVNMEHVKSYASRETAIATYETFADFQQKRRRIEMFKIIRESGVTDHVKQEEGYVAELNEDRFKQFSERIDKKSQAPVWAKSWSGHSIYELCKLSPEPIRRAQYNALFAEWSELAHAAPGAVIPAAPTELSRTMYKSVHTEANLKGSELLDFALRFMIDIWHLLPAKPLMDPHLVVFHWESEARLLADQISHS